MGPVRVSRTFNSVAFYLSLAACISVIYFLISHLSVGSTSNILPIRASSLQKRDKTVNRQISPSIVRYQMNNVTTSGNAIKNRETIIILTPMIQFYPEYWDNLMRLSYPHELITLGFIIPKSRQGNLAMAALQERLIKTQKYGPVNDRFKSIIIERLEYDSPFISQSGSEKYTLEGQRLRRSAIARAKNSLVFTTLNPAVAWVLWLDSDIIMTPPSLIQDLTSHNKPIITPNCFEKYLDPNTKKLSERPYDFSSWQDSEMSQKLGQNIGKDDILLEGYTKMVTHRTLMAYMATENGELGKEVGLDSVGGAVLLVKAEVHRDGAMFPPFSFYHLIESEGFAKMARRLGWNATGLPNYKVYHHFESKL